MSPPTQRSSRVNHSPNREDITEILPNFFLGSEAGAQNLELLRRKGITHIISVMPPDPAHVSAQSMDGFRRINIPVQDWPDEELLTHFKPANLFIDDARITAGEGVLVHCHLGVSRSVTIVAAYLMASHPPIHDYISAVKFLQDLRPLVQPNSGFLDQLALYGRCGCNMEDNTATVEAWRGARDRKWEGRVDQLKRGQAQTPAAWNHRLSRWTASVFG
ncbi:protein-tyrosine phosphatase-like protein [Mycena rosella]|uniref:protein-tyrosine-phosphatase n=1 Tax=Mycena rosella TaxID=1033263 RepID=A0AAD7GF37_MYCRO|nr:protein-tyrosine phosphatase-like protein [Mycena rosella]